VDSSLQVEALIHEMRNELAVAKANLEGLLDGKLAPTRDRLQGIIQALTQLDALIDDLRLANPDVAMPSRPLLVNVCELLNQEYNAIYALAKTKNIQVSIHRCNVTSPQCQQFFGDPMRIGQIAKNVLLNAVRYTPKGGTVEVDCSRHDGQLEVRISDTGPGVSKEETEAVFTPGYRGAASSGTPGSGYGLAVVKQLVEEQGGTITVATDGSHGATFTVRLPGAQSPSTT
jgi:two-component system, OmpR family, sensor histidine kinase BaeS